MPSAGHCGASLKAFMPLADRQATTLPVSAKSYFHERLVKQFTDCSRLIKNQPCRIFERQAMQVSLRLSTDFEFSEKAGLFEPLDSQPVLHRTTDEEISNAKYHLSEFDTRPLKIR